MDDATKTTGNLFVNDYKKQDKHPDYTGYLDISSEQVDAIVAMAQAGQEPKLKLGCWIYPSKRNADEIRMFLVAEPNKPKENKEQGGWSNSKTKVPF